MGLGVSIAFQHAIVKLKYLKISSKNVGKYHIKLNKIKENGKKNANYVILIQLCLYHITSTI